MILRCLVDTLDRASATHQRLQFERPGTLQLCFGLFWVCLREMAEVFKVVAITRGKVVKYIRTYTDCLRARLKLAQLSDDHYDNPEQVTFAILVERL